MFTFRNTTLLFFLLLLLLNILQIAGARVPVAAYFILLSAYILVSVGASFFIRSGFHMKVPCRIGTDKKIISLTFDDGPDPARTPKVLDLLKNRAPAVFFITGKNIEGNEDLIRRMDREGHAVGMHSWFHSNGFDLQPAERMRKEFRRSEEELGKVLGKRPLLFRPPYGVINPMVKNALKSFPYHVTGFSLRSFDTTARDEERILRRLTRKIRPGDIVLLHDTSERCIPVLEKFLTFAEKNGYTFVRADRGLNINAYENEKKG